MNLVSHDFLTLFLTEITLNMRIVSTDNSYAYVHRYWGPLHAPFPKCLLQSSLEGNTRNN